MQKKIGRASQQSVAGPHTKPHTHCMTVEQSKGRHITHPQMLLLRSWPGRNHQPSTKTKHTLKHVLLL